MVSNPQISVLRDTDSESDDENEKNGETSSEYLHGHPQSANRSPTLNIDLGLPSLEIVKKDQKSISTLCSADVPINKQQHENKIACAPPELVSIVEEESIEGTFRGEVQIPGCSPIIFVYPHSSSVIDTTFHDRYREVINIFRHNTKQHSRLKESAQYIDYTLKLCGTSSKDFHPSILVFCRNSEFRDLKGLLTSKELKYQYCLQRKTRKYPWSSSQPLNAPEPYRPLFNLYFWRQRRPRTLYGKHKYVRLHSQSSPLSQRLHMVPELTLCGSVVELSGYITGFSTVGCVIKIFSHFYAITSGHAFRSPEPTKPTKEHQHGEISPHKLMDSPDSSAGSTAGRPGFVEESLYGSNTDISDTTLEDSDYIIDDINYESFEEETGEEAYHSDDSSSADSSDANSDQKKGTDQTRSKMARMILPTSDELKPGDLDLDWALIHLVNPVDWKSNAYIHPSIPPIPVFLSKVAESQPTQERPVFIITSAPTPQRGMLQPGSSMLGGITGRIPSTMWTLLLDEQNSKITFPSQSYKS